MDKRAPDNRSIGVFDSGMGGLTAVRRLHALMPKENIIYFGDTSRVPYGTRGRDTIVKYARQDVAFLRQFDLKAIVIACNTVSSVALDLLAEENNIPIIGTVEPACRRAMTMTFLAVSAFGRPLYSRQSAGLRVQVMWVAFGSMTLS